MLYLQAVKRSHRRLGLAQKLMEQVLSSCCFYYCKIFSCIILKHYYKLCLKNFCPQVSLSFKFFNLACFGRNMWPLFYTFYVFVLINFHVLLTVTPH